MQSWGRQREVERPKRQQSVASLPESAQDAAMSHVDRANEETPSVLIEGHLVHVCQMDEWEVWVNCEDMNFTGVCVGVGRTRNEAVAEAVKALEAIVEHLQLPPP